MPSPSPVFRMTPDEYLDWEKTQEIKHEYADGEVFAMSGASDAHVTIALRVASKLLVHAGEGPCRTYMADMKVKISPVRLFYYPDVVVTSDDRDRSNDYFKEHPKLIIEVLSSSTAAFDRGLKFEHYRLLPSLEEYVLIDSERRGIDCFRRGADGGWVLHHYGPGEEVRFVSVGLSCSVEEIYQGVSFS